MMGTLSPTAWRRILLSAPLVALIIAAMGCTAPATDGSSSDQQASQATATEQLTATSTPAAAGTEATAAAQESSPTPSSPAPVATTAPAATETAPAAAPAALWTVSRIIDGDTVEVESSDGTIETVRVVGIDTPERGECGFSEAGEALGRMVLDQPVNLVAGAQDDRDRYGRILRYVDVRGVDAGLELIRGGFAIARYDSRDGYGRHPREDAYVAADAQAIHICEGTTPAPTAPPAATEPPPQSPAPTAAPPSGGVQVFANCAELNAVYPGGVARVGVEGNMVSGELRPFGKQPVFDDALYAANSARDGDGDGIACES